MVRYLRAIADGQIGAQEACKAYHGDLGKLGIKPYRSLKEDLELTTTATSYAGGQSSAAMAKATPAKAQAAKTAVIPKSDLPDFKSMTSAQKVAYARQRIKADLSRHEGGNSRA